MEKRDPFLQGLRLLIEMRPELNPTNVSLSAGLDKTTVRKLLAGQNASPRIDTANKIAEATGYSLSTIIALGSHPGAKDALDLLRKYDQLDPDERREFSRFLDFLSERRDRPLESGSSH